MVREVPIGVVRNVAVFGVVAFIVAVYLIFALQRYVGASEVIHNEIEKSNAQLTAGKPLTSDQKLAESKVTDQFIAYRSSWISFSYPKGWVKRDSKAHRYVSVASDPALFDSTVVPHGAKLEIRESSMQLTSPLQDLERISPYKVSSRTFQTMKGYEVIEICSKNLEVSWCNAYILLGNRRTIVTKIMPAPEHSKEARYAYESALDSLKLSIVEGQR